MNHPTHIDTPTHTITSERNNMTIHYPEQMLTLKMAAEILNLPLFKLRRAAKQELFPTYTLYNSRRLVRLSEVVAAIENCRIGGTK